MQETEQIKISDTANTHLPLGFRKIHTDKIPLLEIEKKLMLHNQKFKSSTMQILGSNKPISKILK